MDATTSGAAQRGVAYWLERGRFPDLLEELRARGHRIAGPTVRDGAVMLGEIRGVEDLAAGWRDEQEAGRYRLHRSEGPELFGVVNGPESLKRFCFAPREALLQIQMAPSPEEPFEAEPVVPEGESWAILGVRACDLAGLAVQDRIFLRDRYPDPQYAARRRGLFLVAVECTRSVPTCFCASQGTGPAVESGFDLALTELEEGFVARAGSQAGADVVAALSLPEARTDARADAERAVARCAQGMKRSLPARDLRELLYANLEHPQWDDVAERCLSCTNCTLVCPTCFCHEERDEPAVDGTHSLRVREWSSCFDREHGQIHGHNFRPSIKDRYRQWLVHKLAGWIDQYGMSGCVGCGRCITWCPVGIDLTAEVAAIRQEPS